MFSPDKLANYLIILVFAYICRYVLMEVLKKNRSWVVGFLLAVGSPFIVYALLQVTGFPAELELIIAVAMVNITTLVFTLLPKDSSERTDS